MLTVSPRGQDESQAQLRAYATWALIALTGLIYLVQLLVDETRASEIVLRYGVTPEIFTGDETPFGSFPPLLTPLTSMFLHGSWDHLVGNMVYLWVFGDDIEDLLGPTRFVLLYLVCGICGALGYVALDPQATVPLLGASGGVSGLIAATLVLRPCAPVTIHLPKLHIRVAVYWAVGSWILLQLFQYLWHGDEEAFSTLAQAGGVIGGAIGFWLLSPRGTQLFQCLQAQGDSPTDTA